MKVEVYLNFDGNCEEAMKTYEKVFNGKNMEFMRYSDIPVAQTFQFLRIKRTWCFMEK